MSTVHLSFRHVSPHRKFPEEFGAQVFKHRHQEVITKVDETVTCKFIHRQAEVFRKCFSEKIMAERRGHWGYSKPQYRAKNWQKPQYPIENPWNTETAFGNGKLFFNLP